MAKKHSYTQKTKSEIRTPTVSERIEAILQATKPDQRKLIERQARKVWLDYLFQEHKETTVITEEETTEERVLMFGGGNPDSEMVTVRKTIKKTTRETTPKVPVWAIKAALTLDWGVTGKHNELSAIATMVDAGLMPESALDLVVEYSTGLSDVILEATVKSEDAND